jgi:ribonucleoside-diphosphate reductase alpha chain
VVVEFPYSYPEGTKLAKDMSAIDQLKEVERMQREWSDNSVSCTIYYRKEEIPAIRKYLEEHYRDNHKSLSFLLHSDHGFEQAPYEEIDQETYEKLVASTQIIDQIDESIELDDSGECVSGACPIR